MFAVKHATFVHVHLSNNCVTQQFIRSINHQCRLLIVGGGSGGMSMAAKLSKHYKKDEIILVEPNNLHYYQPLFTLVGGGVKKFEDSHRMTKNLVPSKVNWIQDSVTTFNPEKSTVTTKEGHEINYEYMLVAMGLVLNYDQIKGCEDALKAPDSGVCSIYSPKYVSKVYSTLNSFQGGNAFFTFPNSPVKCPGAPQKICYLAEHIFRNQKKRDKANISYTTALPVIFGVKDYATCLTQVAKKKNIHVNCNRNLVEIRSDIKEAVFENLKDKTRTAEKYSVLHVTPPQSTPPALKSAKDLTNEAGFLDVDKCNLQHTKYPNIFGIGDCTNSPNSKTVAAVAAQSKVVYHHLKALLDGKSTKADCAYDGYASCPLVTGFGTCILAEFDYDLKRKETFPIDQRKESWLMYHMKKEVLPPLYWHLMLTGYWNGPDFYRKVLHLGMV